jgi:16S rRNA (cytosine967-C5)-methyltransferase
MNPRVAAAYSIEGKSSLLGFAMTPSARIAAAIDILEGFGTTTQPADRFLKDWFRARRFAGSGDRREITELVFHVLRHRAEFAHRMGREGPRALVIAALLADGKDPAALFTGGYGPEALSQAEQTIIATAPGEAPVWVKGEFPQFLEAELTKRFDDKLLEEMAAFAGRAPVDLRVNTLKATRDEVLARLVTDKFDCAPVGEHGIRCAAGSAGLNKHALFESGAFEIQDQAAQIAVERAGAKPGQRVLDLAAGAGGKSLALAAAMDNDGAIIACDVRGAALAELEKRAARAGVTIIASHILGLPPAGPFDLVFLDVPCSGSGTWRRQPELKWRLTPQKLAGYRETQERLLRQGAALGSRLVYATCSILPSENEEQVEAFLAKNPAFRRWQPDFQASPATSETDGFYAAFLINENGPRI